MDKQALRVQFRKRRSEVENPAIHACKASINLFETEQWHNAKTVLLYHAIGSEITTEDVIIKACHENKLESQLRSLSE